MKPLILLSTLCLAIGNVTAQNDCGSALPVAAGTYTVPSIDGTLPTFVCIGTTNGAQYAEWYAYTPSNDVSLTVSTSLPQNFGGDTRLSIFTGTCGSLICAGGDDDSGDGYLSMLTINAEAGTTYYIVFDDFWEATGFDFLIVEGPYIENLVSFTSTPITHGGFIMACADMNGDHLDDVIAVDDNDVDINYQLPEGGFQHAVMNAGNVENVASWSIAVGDIDKNGYNDLLYGGGGGVSLIWANDDGTAYTETHDGSYIFCQRTNFVDINNDGNLDAFSCHDIAPNCYYLNDGSNNMSFHQGGLGDVVDGGNYGSVWIDYDNDCDIDMFIAKCRGGNSLANINQLHRNNGDGTFTEVGEEAGLADNVQTWSSAWADYDNDGDMDVFVGASSDEHGMHKLMRNNGDGTFTNVTEGSGIEFLTGTSIENQPADFNNDGWVDIFGAGDQLLMNNGDMTFTASVAGVTFGPLGDVNNDGFLDVMSGNGVNLNAGNENNFMKVNLVGIQSNGNGIGARVTLYTPDGNQIRDIRSGEGFRYCGSLNAHFGMGEGTVITKITVCWPSGIVDEVMNPSVNSTITIIEGLGVDNVKETESATLSIFPNPAYDVLNVNMSGVHNYNLVKVTIMDLSGKIVSQPSARNRQVDISSLPVGMYMIRVEAEGQVVQKKFAKN